MNNVSIVGRVGSNPELRHTKGGLAILEFPVRVGYGDRVDWIPITMFGDKAEKYNQHLSKGMVVGVSGYLHSHEWEGQDGTTKSRLDVRVFSIDVLGNDATAKSSPKAKSQPKRQEERLDVEHDDDADFSDEITEDDIF